MKKLFTLFAVLFMIGAMQTTIAQYQYGLNPSDPNVVFTTNNRPDVPAWNDYGIVKWGHTNRLGWNPYNKGYKAYLYRGMAFRLKFPKTYVHGVSDGKKYPLLIFFHGRGEAGTVYDNEYQLLHGGELHANRVDDGTFDGFLFYAQSTTGNSQDYFPFISELIDSMANSVKVDIDRVMVSGLSSGGQASWDFIANSNYARKVASSIPMVAASTNYLQYFNNYLTLPIWVSNGGQDPSPAPFTVDYVVNAFRALGGNIRQTTYPNLGHGIWNTFWQEPDYFPYMNRQHKANPLVYFQRSEFCPNDAVSVRMAVQPGFYAYQWEKDGQLLPGVTSNEYTATSFGTYRVRFQRTASSEWSAWSPSPVVVGQKPGTVTPPIQINGMKSNVLPAPDGSTVVPLMVPEGYASYEWRRVSDNALVSSANTYNAPVGSYRVMVSEQFGCSSSFSDPYTVINANATNGPDKAVNLSAISLTSTKVRLDWNDNPSPVYNETGFEIYRSATAGTGYTMVGKVGSNVLFFEDEQVISNTLYYYVVRAVNNNAAAPLSNEVSVTTLRDEIPPTVPTSLTVTGTGRNEVSLSWEASTDNAGPVKYEVYVNGIKSYVTSETEFTVPELTYLQSYSFYVRAKDMSGNLSPQSNQVTAYAALSGLSYKYYEGDWDALPDFNTLTPVRTGNTANVSLAPRLRNDYFGFLWEGFIKIPATGSYTFETNSDDGSKLYIGTYSHTATPLVNNDGLHGTQYRSGTITLTAGVHPIAITFFEKTGGEAMEIYWRSTAAGINNRTAIPNSAFTDNVSVPAANLPAAPTNLLVTANSYNKITVNWTDASNNEIGFEITRGTSMNGPFLPVGTVGANVTTYEDETGLEPNTRYWYQVRAVNNFGASNWLGEIAGKWSLNNSYADDMGSTRTLSPNNNPSFSTDRSEGSHAVSLNGSNQSLNMNWGSSQFPSNAYGSRTVAVWVKPTSTSSSNKIIVDLGGSTHGLGLRINSGTIQAGISRNSSRHTASANTNNANGWVTNGWNHVAAVYTGTQLKLYVNGVERASTNLSSTSTIVGSTSNNSRLGANDGNNAFNSSTSSTNFSGLIDDLNIFDGVLNAAGITAVMNGTYGSAQTQAAPPPPAVPGSVAATALSTTQVQLTWNDASANETGFHIYRSVSNNTNFRLLAIVDPGNGGQQTYTDENLFANTHYFYKVLATGTTGNSAFSSGVSAKTLNNPPVIGAVSDVMMRHSSTRVVGVFATDADAEVLTMTATGLPPFANFMPGNGTAVLAFLNPQIAQVGTYPITIQAADGNGGTASTSFTLTVNSNYVPVVFPIAPVSVNEGTTANVNLIASDQDGSASLVWSIVEGPSFAMITSANNGNGVGVLNLTPGYAHAGTYTIKLKVRDDIGAETETNLMVTVNNVELAAETIFMSTVYYSAPAPAPWNNLYNTSTSNLVNSNGQVTPIGIDFLNTPWNAGDAGAVTNNNSGVYPDAVIRDYFWFGIYGAPETVTFQIRGLSVGSQYNLTLFGSSAWTGVGNNGTTVYTVGGVSKPLYVDNNSQNTVTFDNVTPNNSGVILVTMSKAAGTPYGVLNAIVLQKTYNDGTAPLLPDELAAVAQADGSIKLTWKDVAYNESRYLVHRSTSLNGTYTVINPGASNTNSTSYVDNSVVGNTTYYYKLEAENEIGSSGLTAAVNATSLNKAPVLANIVNQVINGGTSLVLNVLATDEPGDDITITAHNLPSFAQFQLTGTGTASLTFNPGFEDVGTYNNLIVRAQDQRGAFVADTFNITVLNPNVRSVLLNFGSSNTANAMAPWNNSITWPTANVLMTNLRDQNNVTSNFGVRLTTTWNGVYDNGMITGGNRGIYPDDVIAGGYISTTTTGRVIQIEGLDQTKRYNIGVFGSNHSGINCAFTISSASQNVLVDARYNTTKTGYLNGLAPNAQGVIQITLTKESNSDFMVLNAMVIEEYAASTFVNPFDLFAESILETNQMRLTWSERSNSETGYQVWRSTSPGGGYTLVGTTAANATTYTDQTASPDVRYYYKVRAVNGGNFSSYSNVATNVLSSSIVKINFNANAAQNAPAPWNNTNGPSSEGLVFDKLKNQSNINSGIAMTITKEFNGPGFAGVNTTGGIFPGVVMESNYWTDAGQLSQVKFSNLALNKKYRIGMFGSAVFFGNSVARYTVNGQVVYLNSLSNTTKIVYLDNLTPNEDGEIVLDVNTQSGYPYSFTGALTIEGYLDNGSGGGREDGNEMVTPIYVKGTDPKDVFVDKKADNTLNVFPNPFVDKFQVELTTEQPAKVHMMLFDLSGRMVYEQSGLKTISGLNRYEIIVPQQAILLPGSYFLSVIRDGKPLKAVKLIKVQ